MSCDAGADIRELFDIDGHLLPMQQWPDSIAVSVKAIQPGPFGTKVVLNDKLAALRIILGSRDPLRPRRLDDQPYSHTQPRQHVDQCISAEQVNATTQKVAYSGLGDPEYFPSLRLCKSSRRDGLLDLNQQVSFTKALIKGFTIKRIHETRAVCAILPGMAQLLLSSCVGP